MGTWKEEKLSFYMEDHKSVLLTREYISATPLSIMNADAKTPMGDFRPQGSYIGKFGDFPAVERLYKFTHFQLCGSMWGNPRISPKA